SNVPGVVCMIVAKTLSDRAHSCPHWGLAMDRDQNAGVQHYEIEAAISRVVSQDAPDFNQGSSHHFGIPVPRVGALSGRGNNDLHPAYYGQAFASRDIQFLSTPFPYLI
ncbi:MAG: hypothetical protein WBH07_07735, partial [Candidatus Methanoculleus thermohydrogenotrophicum]